MPILYTTCPFLQILECVDEGADALEPDPHLLPILDEPLWVSGPSNAARRAHLDDGALLESRALTQEGYRLSAVEDHVPAGKVPPVSPELMVAGIVWTLTMCWIVAQPRQTEPPSGRDCQGQSLRRGSRQDRWGTTR